MRILLSLLVGVCLPACGGDDSGDGGDSDTDTDADTDTDTDADTDTDTDTDTDADTDSDSDADPTPFCEHSCSEPVTQDDCPEFDVDACVATCVATGSAKRAQALDGCMHAAEMVDCATAQACVDEM